MRTSSARPAVGLSVPARADLDGLGLEHSGVTDVGEPVPYSALVLRDPDNIQLEPVHLSG